MLRLASRRSPLPWIAVAAVAVSTVATHASGATPPLTAAVAAVEPPSTGDRAVFQPVTPVRVLDTRKAPPVVPAKGERVVQVAGVSDVPADAVAVVLNVTAVTPTASGYLTVYPTGSARPTASTVNFLANQVVANLATVRLGTDGKVTVYNALNAPTGGTHVVMDLAGYYRAHAHDDRYLPKADAQARTADGAFTCAGGTLLQSVAADGAPTCVTDQAGPAYTAGNGLTLTGTVFSAEQGRSAANAFTCANDSYLRAVAADGTPTCVTAPPPVQAGFGLLLDQGVLSAEQGRSAVNAFTCSAGQYLQAVAANGAPTCAIERVGPTYAAGSGITISGTSISAHQSRSAANSFTCPAGQYLQSVAATGAPTCGTVPSYAAGSGLLLSNGTFSSAYGPSVVPLRADLTPAENGLALYTLVNSINGATAATPYLIALAPGTYDLGGTILSMRPYISIVGAGRGVTTITGSLTSGSAGLVNLGNNTTLAGVTINNTRGAGGGWATALMSNGAVTARVIDVAATATQEGGNTFGLISFNGGNITVQDSTFTGVGGVATGIYALNNSTVRGRGVEAHSSGASGRSLQTDGSGRIDLSDSYANGPVERINPTGELKIAHSRIDGAVTGGVLCFGNYSSAFAAVTCA